MTAENLSQALQEAIINAAMRQRASNLGSRIRAEDGVAKAVEIIQRIKI